jgi:hypothetical protein
VEEGWVRVTLNADAKDFYVKVSDSGLGIPEESMDKIFERFYRVDKSHSREIGGTGLGLAITRSAIGMHHGTIRVESKEGEGTTFHVRIPLVYVPDQPEPAGGRNKKRQFRRKAAEVRKEKNLQSVEDGAAAGAASDMQTADAYSGGSADMSSGSGYDTVPADADPEENAVNDDLPADAAENGDNSSDDR